VIDVGEEYFGESQRARPNVRCTDHSDPALLATPLRGAGAASYCGGFSTEPPSGSPGSMGGSSSVTGPSGPT
jgi:hypothetical protein